MTRRVVLVLAVALLAAGVPVVAGVGSGASAGVEAGAQVRPEPRGSIWIEGDEELANHSAVRGGNGTAENPYVISNWTIVDTAGASVSLRGTSAHVAIRNVSILGAANEALVLGGELLGGCQRVAQPVHTCGGARGLRLVDTSNVTVRDVVVTDGRVGAEVRGSEDIGFDRVRLGYRSPVLQSGQLLGLSVSESTGVSFSNFSIPSAQEVASIHEVVDVRFADASLQGVSSQSDILVQGGEGLEFVRSEMQGTQLKTIAPVDDLSLLYSKVSNHTSFQGILASAAPIDDLEICGSKFSDLAKTAHLPLVTNASIRGSVFRNNADGLFLDAPDVVFEHNLVQNTSGQDGSALRLDSLGAQVHENGFQDNPWIAATIMGVDANLTDNWWDDPDGPQVEPDQPERGEILDLASAENATYEPWLQAPAQTGPDAVDCGVPQGPPGVKERPRFSVSADANASVSAALPGIGEPVPS